LPSCFVPEWKHKTEYTPSVRRTQNISCMYVCVLYSIRFVLLETKTQREHWVACYFIFFLPTSLCKGNYFKRLHILHRNFEIKNCNKLVRARSNLTALNFSRTTENYEYIDFFPF
jgi:hypothetical protein